MGFGLSGDNERTKMVGGDVTIAWMDHGSGKFYTNHFQGIQMNTLSKMTYVAELF